MRSPPLLVPDPDRVQRYLEGAEPEDLAAEVWVPELGPFEPFVAAFLEAMHDALEAPQPAARPGPDPVWFRMRQEVDGSTAIFDAVALSRQLPFRSRSWITGEPLVGPIPRPLVYTVEEEGRLGPFLDLAAPLMADELVQVLVEAGVEGLELHDAVLRDPRGQQLPARYRAVNVTRKVRLADPAASSGESLGGLGTWWTRLVPSPDATDLPLFRLAESPSKIVVHRRIRDAVLALGLPLLAFDSDLSD